MRSNRVLLVPNMSLNSEPCRQGRDLKNPSLCNVAPHAGQTSYSFYVGVVNDQRLGDELSPILFPFSSLNVLDPSLLSIQRPMAIEVGKLLCCGGRRRLVNRKDTNRR